MKRSEELATRLYRCESVNEVGQFKVPDEGSDMPQKNWMLNRIGMISASRETEREVIRELDSVIGPEGQRQSDHIKDAGIVSKGKAVE